MLILGYDIGNETNYVRAVDTRGRELSKSAFPFSNSLEGFQSAKEWAVKLAATHNKEQIVLSLEPVLSCHMDDFKWNQCCSGEPHTCKTDEGN